MAENEIPSLAVFDCDGTIVDSQHVIVSTATAAWRSFGLEDPNPVEVRQVVGLPLVEAIGRLLPENSPDDHVAIAERYRDAFQARRSDQDLHEPLYEGAAEVLQKLDSAGVLLAIATGKGRRGLDAVLERHGLREYFIVLKTADDGPGKPNPAILLDAMSETGVPANRTAMIGDTVFDIKMACAARTHAVGVSWGYHETDALWQAGADHVVERFSQLPELLQSIWGT